MRLRYLAIHHPILRHRSLHPMRHHHLPMLLFHHLRTTCDHRLHHWVVTVTPGVHLLHHRTIRFCSIRTRVMLTGIVRRSKPSAEEQNRNGNERFHFIDSFSNIDLKPKP